MSKKMLIDASHAEETRVVIVNDGKVEDLDFEASNKRQLRGNVYLARVTRVEPSLQAAFIEYGGNRHGFLAFPEIHPDYYQIPYEDKLALQAEEEEMAAEAEEDDDVEEDENLDPDDDDTADENDAEVASEQVKVASTRRKRISKRRYKIQEVIKRGQILLVQAVKEERGNKGAAMTTYLSLAGRYCVLMPNTPRGGGISRKIANGTDRKRLKSIMGGLDVPQGMGVIVRTAGAKRTKTDIKRDYDYLSKLWDDIRDTTMNSIAPALIHEEGNLVKRALRDLYNKDIDEVIVSGDEAHTNAKAFMTMLMPSHAKNMKKHESPLPLFLEYGVEKQIEASLDATVQLKSGGYLVIHPTEALVSVDVNSGRSTKERNVERTALKTNLEAADEVARQMRLRDLAGLIVIDFIDMDENKNNRAVEKRMKDAVAKDRARLQYGKISQFGLMEISRQRRRRSLLEGSTTVCRHCDGVGRKRTVESSALKAIRGLEEMAARGKAAKVRLKVPDDVAHYIVNEKRDLLVTIEENLGTFTEVVGDEELIRPIFELEVLEKSKGGRDRIAEAEKDHHAEDKKLREAKKAQQKAREAEEKAHEDDEDDEAEGHAEHSDDDEDKPRRRRRGRRGGRNRRKPRDEETSREESGTTDSEDDDDAPKPRRRRRAPAQDSQAVEEAVEAVEDAVETPKRGRRRAPAKTAADKTADEKTVSRDSSRRRKAPSRTKAPSRKNDEGEVEETSKSRTRRKAPSKSSGRVKAPNVDAAIEQEGMPDAVEDAPVAKGRRKAPSKKAAPKKAAPKKAAAKTGASKTEVSKTAAPKKAAAKKAPARKAAPKAAAKASSTSDDTEASKPTRRRAAPKTAAAKKAPVKKAAPKKAAPRKAAPRKTAAAKAEAGTPVEMAPDQVSEAKASPRKAPARKAPAKKAPARKAPARKPAAKTEPQAKPKTEPQTEPMKTAAPAAKADAPAKAAPAVKAPVRPAAKAAPKADAPKKRGWWNRIIGD